MKITEYSEFLELNGVSGIVYVNENGLDKIEDGKAEDGYQFVYQGQLNVTFKSYNKQILTQINEFIDSAKQFVTDNPLNEERITDTQKSNNLGHLIGFNFNFSFEDNDYTINSSALVNSQYTLIKDSKVFKNDSIVANFAHANFLNFQCYTEDVEPTLEFINNVISYVNSFVNDNMYYITEEVNLEDKIDTIKHRIIDRINAYDNSVSVNQFYYEGIPMWLDKATRVGLMNSINIEKSVGKEETNIWFDNKQIKINIEEAIAMLSQLELYALQCYNVTAKHLFNVNQLTTVEELRNYDFREGYPEKLRFKNNKLVTNNG